MDDNTYFVEPLTQRELEILELLADGLSNREIAQRLVIAPGTVKWYNKQIYSKLHVHSREEAVIKAQDAGLLESQKTVSEYNLENFTHNIPTQLTSFIGRESEITEVKRLLGNTRLLTLTGPPGTGKTRLGIQVATEIINQFDDGAYFIELAPISDPALVASTIAQVFGIRETAEQPLKISLKNYFREKRLLILIDNFEQVIDAALLVSELFSGSPGVKALVTSREALRVYGEQEYSVPPLKLPDPERVAPLNKLGKYEAVDLFCQRARAVKSDFLLTKKNAPFVSEICIRLEGLPLAIELATARSKLLSPQSICTRLDSCLSTLVGGSRDHPERMQTLRAAIDWSYELLESSEKTLFARLAVFQGGRSEKAVEAICGRSLGIDVLDGLESLLNKSLLGQETGRLGEPRFVMLEMIHEYARERLEESGEAERLRQRHTTYFLDMAEQAALELRGPGYVYWSLRLKDEHNNFRTALDWSLSGGDVELGLQLASALRDFWAYEGYSREGLEWIQRGLERAKDPPLAIHARALNAAGWLSFEQGEHDKGKFYNGNALAHFREMGDEENSAWALAFLSTHFLALPGGLKEALKLCEEGLALFRNLNYRQGIAFSLNNLGELSRMTGDFERARCAYKEGLINAGEEDDKLRQAILLSNLGYIELRAGENEQAEATVLKAIALFVELENTRYIPQNLAELAGPMAAQGNAEKAARLLGASEALLEKMGFGVQSSDLLEIERYIAATREQLDEATFNAAWSEGRAMSLDEAVAYAMGNDTD